MTTRISEQTIDVSGIFDDETLHEYLSKTLGFPGYYGWNWEAFWDCISSDDQSSMPTLLKIRGIAELRREAPESARQLESCLGDYVAEFKDRVVEFPE
jgi:ribonuclease inhibitor